MFLTKIYRGYPLRNLHFLMFLTKNHRGYKHFRLQSKKHFFNSQNFIIWSKNQWKFAAPNLKNYLKFSILVKNVSGTICTAPKHKSWLRVTIENFWFAPQPLRGSRIARIYIQTAPGQISRFCDFFVVWLWKSHPRFTLKKSP